jgi:hypothetical protein
VRAEKKQRVEIARIRWVQELLHAKADESLFSGVWQNGVRCLEEVSYKEIVKAVAAFAMHLQCFCRPC